MSQENRDEVQVNSVSRTDLHDFNRGWSKFYITVEPIYFIINFTTVFTSGITIDLLQDHVCLQNYNYTLEECNKGLPTETKSEIEAMTADVYLANNVMQGVFPAILSLFIGPWSDTNGRKHFLKWSLCGYTSFYSLWGLLSLIPDIPIMCFILPAVPLSLSGGWIALMVSTWSYIGDAYKEQERPLRLSILLCCGLFGNFLGNALASEIFDACRPWGYQVMFFTSAGLTTLALFYSFYILEETITKKNKTKLFDTSHFKSIFVALIMKPRHNPTVSLLTMIILASEITANAADASMVYLVGKSEYSWTLRDFNLFSVLTTIISAFSPLLGIWIFQKLLHWHNYGVLTLFSCIMFIMNFLKAVSINETMFWISACGLKLASILAPCVDTEMSKIVDKNDIGKAYAFSSLVDAMSPIISLPVFTAVYKSLLPDKTLQVFFLKAGLSAITFISSLLLLILFTLKRKMFWNMNVIS